jgi:hypothetical protein
VVVGAIVDVVVVVDVDVVVGAVVVVVVVVVVDDVGVEEVVDVRGGAATPVRESCHCESTYDAAPPTTSAVTTSSTMPTLRLDEPA